MRYAGKITEWNDERGFGFVVPDRGGDRVFMHISELKARPRRPCTGDRVSWTVSKDSRGRRQARAVGFVGSKRARRLHGSSRPRSRSAFGVVALAAVAVAFSAGLLPPVIAGAYLVFSCLSLLAYMKDKHAAKTDTWRTPESTLLVLGLVGGWPGALIAQQRLRHKTIKQPFQTVFWLSIMANIGGVWWLATSGMAAQLWASAVG